MPLPSIPLALYAIVLLYNHYNAYSLSLDTSSCFTLFPLLFVLYIPLSCLLEIFADIRRLSFSFLNQILITFVGACAIVYLPPSKRLPSPFPYPFLDHFLQKLQL